MTAIVVTLAVERPAEVLAVAGLRELDDLAQPKLEMHPAEIPGSRPELRLPPPQLERE